MAARPAASASVIRPLECSEPMTLVSVGWVTSVTWAAPSARAQNLQAGGGVRRHRFDQRAGQRGDVHGPTSLAGPADGSMTVRRTAGFRTRAARARLGA